MGPEEHWRYTITQELPGSVLVGGYRLEELMGAGGMGAVYRALGPRGPVAIKVLRPELREDKRAFARFEREAIGASALQHPNVIGIHGFELRGAQPFLVMDLVDGEPLSETLARGPLSLPRALEICRDVLSGLAAAHHAGLVHRDIKPDNIMVSGRRAIILDFGIVKLHESEGHARLTASGMTVGTPAYMAPEQLRGGEIGPATDLWATGSVLHEMLTGEPPFSEPRSPEALYHVLSSPAPRLAAARRDLPDALQPIVDRCLEKDPAERFPSAEAMNQAIAALQPPLRRTASWPDRRSWVLFWGLALGALALGLGMAVGILTFHRPDTSNSPEVAVFDRALAVARRQHDDAELRVISLHQEMEGTQAIWGFEFTSPAARESFRVTVRDGHYTVTNAPFTSFQALRRPEYLFERREALVAEYQNTCPNVRSSLSIDHRSTASVDVITITGFDLSHQTASLGFHIDRTGRAARQFTTCHARTP
ncbi:MAG: serine/threonine-protein kinase [Myxococcota bacterium]